jgi:hypothetical protein
VSVDSLTLATLRDLELRLLSPDVRSDPTRLGALLHAEFYEVGASGRAYTRAEVLVECRRAAPSGSTWVQDFLAQEVLVGIILLRYRSAQISSDGATSRHALRTSLWQNAASGWQLRFHQGTPTDPFEKHTTEEHRGTNQDLWNSRPP